MVMLNSTYQVEWFRVAAAIVLVASRRHWRQVLAVACVLLVLILTWYVKDAVMFGTTTTSSWLGMNLRAAFCTRRRPRKSPSLSDGAH